MDFTASSTGTPGGLITLLSLKGVGPQTAERWAGRFQTLGEILEADPQALGKVPAAAQDSIRDKAAWRHAHQHALEVLDKASHHGVAVLGVRDSGYPELLKGIADRPLVVYVRGQLTPGRRSVACIGTREPSRFGIEVTKRLTAMLARERWSVVSGLALGVDSLAHEAALDAGGHTVAVLANGLDTIYPRNNAALAERILEGGGALLSEQPFGERAIPRHLVQRDRLQSGLAVATFVMQTGVVGGSMHTVRFTLQQGRLLFAAVPSGRYADDPKSQGPLALTQNTGRNLVTILGADGAYADLLRAFFADRPPAIPVANRGDYTGVLARLEDAVTTPQAHQPAMQSPLL